MMLIGLYIWAKKIRENICIEDRMRGTKKKGKADYPKTEWMQENRKKHGQKQ